MAHYLAPIFREQFNQFYSFGYTVIPKVNVIEFDGKVNDEVKTRLTEHFSVLPPFEYELSYLILHLESENHEESLFFDIQDIIAIYPLSNSSKDAIEDRLPQNVKLGDPVFESILPIIQTKNRNKQASKAIQALWHLCGIKDDVYETIERIGLQNLYKGLEYRSQSIKAYQIFDTNNKESYWTYLLAYDRYEPFSKDTLGYFYDAGEIFSFSKGKSDGLSNTKIFEFLEEIKHLNPMLNLDAIVKKIESNPLASKYVSDPISNEIRHYIVAPLFLRWKDETKNCGNNISDITLIKPDTRHIYIKKFPDEVKAAIVLLGVFYGFQQPLYDVYYNSLNLRIHRNPNPKKVSGKVAVNVIKPPAQSVYDNKLEVPLIVEWNINNKSDFSDLELGLQSNTSHSPVLDLFSDEIGDNSNYRFYKSIIPSIFKNKNEFSYAEFVREIKSKNKGIKIVQNELLLAIEKHFNTLEIIKKGNKVIKIKKNI